MIERERRPQAGKTDRPEAAKVEIGRWDEKDPRRSRGAETPLGRLETLAWVLDSSIAVPGTNFRIGIDALIGLVPVLGDVIGVAFSTYILVMAAKMGVPRVTLLRMGFNVTLEAVVGVIPFVGDAFDFVWKANKRNVELLRAHVTDPDRARKGDWLFAAAFLIFTAAVLGALGWGGFLLGRTVVGWFAGG
jgi:hypothetical protein